MYRLWMDTPCHFSGVLLLCRKSILTWSETGKFSCSVCTAFAPSLATWESWHPNRCVIVAHWDFNIHFPKDRWCGGCFDKLIYLCVYLLWCPFFFT
jgi:hypothetical protein